MFVIIKDENKIIKTNIEKEYQYLGIHISISKDVIELSNDYYFDDNTRKKSIVLEEYSINKLNRSEPISIYLYENDNGINDYQIYEKQDFTLDSNNASDIVIKDFYMMDYYLKLKENKLETNCSFLLLNGNYYNHQELVSGDYIELLGFSFYYYSSFLYINNFNVINNLSIKKVEEKEQLDRIIPYELSNIYEEPKKIFKLDEIKEFNKPRKNNSRKLVLQIGPTITMSLAMVMLATINIYNSYLNNSLTALGIVALIIMPVTMLISGIIWPILSSSSDKRAYKREYNEIKKEYLEYLKEYDSKLEKSIQEYVYEENKYYFKKDNIKDKLFYINEDSIDFMNLTLGYQNKIYDIIIPYTKDKDIDETLNRIKYRLNHIDNCPLFLNIKENKNITIIINEKNRLELFKSILLELSSKYHYENMGIAIYAKDKDAISDIFDIPHLFINEERMTLINERELQKLNSIKREKPIVLLMMEKSETTIDNPNIYSILFSSSNKQILKKSKCIIEYDNNNTGILRKDGCTSFKYQLEKTNFKECFNYISLYVKNDELKKTLSFRELNKDLSIYNNYLDNYDSLKAEFATINNEILSFDLHETKDGPHGLIGGSTGSGKSELIVSLLLSLAIRYSPKYLNIILIDYKGGGIKESLTYGKQVIPHIIADVNNLENDTFERLIVAIDRECRKRQTLFKKLSIKAQTSIMNIDDYLENYKNYNFESIAHLVIVVDEFAELKKENPFIIKELISFARIGRSLGVHLILATQKPSGVIDDEIWSNSHFKIALKVHNEKDSLDIIKQKDAAYLTKPGEFYLQVDDNIIKAKALYSKKDINDNDQFEVKLLDNMLKPIKKKIIKKNNVFLEASYLSKQILQACHKLNININNLEFEKPLPLSRIALLTKYGDTSDYVFGEVDDYLNAKKTILKYPVYNNLLIYSNRKYEINSIINTLTNNVRRTIIIGSSRYNALYISDSLIYSDEEDIEFLLNKLLNDKTTHLTLIIEDLSTLLSYNEEYVNNIYQLIRRSTISAYSLVILTKQSTISFKLLNSIQNKLVIESNDYQDLINIFSSKGEYKGKSFYYDETPISFIPTVEEEIIEDKTKLSPYIDSIPANVKYKYDNNQLLIGYDYKTRKEILINDREILYITSFDEEILKKYQLLFIKNTNIKIVKYSINLINENSNYVLWIGEGLFSQKLFYVDKDYSLKEDEGFLFKYSKGKVIRVVDYE